MTNFETIGRALASIEGKTFPQAFGREPTAAELRVILAHRMAREASETARAYGRAHPWERHRGGYDVAREAGQTVEIARAELAAMVTRLQELAVARRRVREAIGTVRARQVGYLYGRAFEDQARAARLDIAILQYRLIQSDAARVGAR